MREWQDRGLTNVFRILEGSAREVESLMMCIWLMGLVYLRQTRCPVLRENFRQYVTREFRDRVRGGTMLVELRI